MKWKIISFLLITLLIIFVFYQYSENNVEDKEEVKLEVSKKDSKKKEVENDVQKKEVFEPIPILGNSGMLFETKEDAIKWAKEENITSYEIQKCEWKWEDGFKDHGLDGEIYYTIKRK